jgi:hypothetical protein
VGGLDQRRLAHTARAPEQGIVCGKTAREAAGVLDQRVAHAVDAFEQRHLDPVDARDRREAAALRMPDERRRFREIRIGFGRGRKPLEGRSDPRQQFGTGLGLRSGLLRGAGLLLSHWRAFGWRLP